MNLEYEIAGEESDCSYLPGQQARMTYRLVMEMSAARYESLLQRGWRRFGRTLFRPACAACRACQSLRIDIPAFRPSRSQRRILQRSLDIEVTIGRPTVTPQHLELYNAYHLDMHRRRGWPFRKMDRSQYHESFLDGSFEFSREFQYRQDGRLVGVGLVDVTDHAMSSIYFFHDPACREAALGTFSVLKELDDGQRMRRQWLYMGYYIRDCPSMNYKNRFSPHQILQSYVADDQDPEWL